MVKWWARSHISRNLQQGNENNMSHEKYLNYATQQTHGVCRSQVDPRHIEISTTHQNSFIHANVHPVDVDIVLRGAQYDDSLNIWMEHPRNPDAEISESPPSAVRCDLENHPSTPSQSRSKWIACQVPPNNEDQHKQTFQWHYRYL